MKYLKTYKIFESLPTNSKITMGEYEHIHDAFIFLEDKGYKVTYGLSPQNGDLVVVISHTIIMGEKFDRLPISEILPDLEFSINYLEHELGLILDKCQILPYQSQNGAPCFFRKEDLLNMESSLSGMLLEYAQVCFFRK